MENWREPDRVNENFVRVDSRRGTAQQLRGADWAEAFLEVDLCSDVPEDVRDLFEVARGAMLYGWFFYPLFMLGQEQLFRVAEAAARSRYRQAGGGKPRPSFAEVIDYLVAEGLIAEVDRERWTAARHLRNAGSHPDIQSVMPPGATLGILHRVAEDVDRLLGCA